MAPVWRLYHASQITGQQCRWMSEVKGEVRREWTWPTTAAIQTSAAAMHRTVLENALATHEASGAHRRPSSESKGR